MTLDSVPELARRVLHLEMELKRNKPSHGTDNAALLKRISALESSVAMISKATPAKPQVYTPKPAATVPKPTDKSLATKMATLEREIEKLKVKKSPAAWLDWTPTVTGWAAGYTCIARYCKVGKMCFVYLYIAGTSNDTKARATLPLSVSGKPTWNYFQVPYLKDNSTTDNIGGRCFAQVRPSDESEPNQIFFWLDGSAQGWTASGDKMVSVSFFYEVA